MTEHNPKAREHDGYSHVGIPPGCAACRDEQQDTGGDELGGWGMLPIAFILAMAYELIVRPFRALWRFVERMFRRHS